MSDQGAQPLVGWAGVAAQLAGEQLPALALLGAALIVAASMIGEWRPRRRRG